MSKRYIEYLDSGAPWISDVESLRGMTRLKHVSTVQTGITLSGEGNPADPEWPYLRVANVQVGYVAMREIKTVRVSPDRAAASMLQPGDVLMTEGGDIDKLGRGALWRGQVPDMLHQNHIFAVRPSEALDSEFFVYWLDGSVARTYFRTTAKQTTNLAGTNKWTLGNLPIPVRPLEEQHAIADYLDRETARIDTLIEEQQRLIEMLRERREATIRSALLSGLDDAETAPSGVELLGTVPKHWRMVRTRYLCTITTGSEDSGNATDDGEYPFYVRGREILRIDHYSFEGEAVMTPGDGQGGTGKVFHYFDGKFEAHQRVYVFTDFMDVTGWYFYYFLSTFLRPVALAGSNTVTMESLRRPLLADFKVAVPPIDEQQRITAYLDDQTAKIDTLMTEAERFIDLARERRSALITAAVTGKVDVREAL
ncbi:restriction endonuclease subunit S [Amycolatopsis sp. NPDC058278]|uniref:restriction endonuclease subunit S n=1 Tax=Amycolatopsis sp. NPDC058278 TaxID=3346417 RepID=UPI0036DF3D5D